MGYVCYVMGINAKILLRSVPEVEVLYVDDERLQEFNTVTLVNFTVNFAHAETILVAEERLKHLVTVLVEDIPTSPRNKYLGKQQLCTPVLLVHLEVLNEELRIFAQTLNISTLTILN